MRVTFLLKISLDLIFVSFNSFLISLIFSACSGYSSAFTGKFTSPNYPNIYPANSYCEYVVDIPGAITFNIEFQEFLLETNFDFLYYGNNTLPLEDEALDYFTGYSLPPSLDIPGQTIWFIFTSDGSNSYKGFELTWKATGKLAIIVVFM